MNLFSQDNGGAGNESFIIDKEKNKIYSCEKGIAKQVGVGSSKDTVLSGTAKDCLPPKVHDTLSIPFVAPAVPYFTDPTVLSLEESDKTSESTSSKGHKYFRTPLPSNARIKKQLTPLMEEETESNVSQEWKSQDMVPRSEMQQVNTQKTGAKVEVSPMHTPLYQSFFADECQEIVQKLEGREIEGKCSGKRKVEEMELSTIDAEPPPYDWTPMKSMLGSEVAKIYSLENSPAKEGPSLFGESLLDLDKMELQLREFNFTEDCKPSSTLQSLHSSTLEGITLLGDVLYDGVCSRKKQKTELTHEKQDIHKTTELHTPVSSLLQCNSNVSLHAHSPLGTEADLRPTIYSDTGEVIKVTDLLSSEVKMNKSLPEMMGVTLDKESLQDHLNTKNTTLETETSNTTLDIAPMNYEVIIVDITELNKADGKSSVNVTQDILPVYGDFPAGNTTQVIEVVHHVSPNTTQDIMPVSDGNTANTTQVIDVSSKTSANTTQDIMTLHEFNAANSPTINGALPKTSANITQDIVPVSDIVTVNTTQVIEASSKTSANTTQDIMQIHDDFSAGNTCTVIACHPKTSANTTQDIEHLHEDTVSANTPEINAVPKISANTTQDLMQLHDESNTATTPTMAGAMPKTSANITQDILPLHEEPVAANTPEIMEPISKTSANTTQDVLQVHDEFTAANTPAIMGTLAKISANTTQDIVTLHEEVIADITPLKMKAVPKTSTNNTQGIAQVHGDFIASKTPTVLEAVPKSSTNTPQDIVLSNKEVISVHTSPIPKAVPTLSANTTQDITAASIPQLAVSVANDYSPLNTTCDTSPRVMQLAQNVPVTTNDIRPSLEGSIQITGSIPAPVYIAEMTEVQSLEAEIIAAPATLMKQTKDSLLHELAQVPVSSTTTMTESHITSTVPSSESKKMVLQNRMAVIAEMPKAEESISKRSSVDCCLYNERDHSNSQESESGPRKSEPCDLIQEAETTHDESVFSVGSFVTSTPVPGLNNFQFKKSCQDSVHHESNLSFSSVTEETAKKLTVEQRVTTHHGSLGVQLDNAQGRRELSRGTQLPCTTGRSIPSQVEGTSKPLQPACGIPSARRSLALTTASMTQKLGKEPMPSQIPSRGNGIPVRGCIRPPLNRNSLSKASGGNLRQSTGGSVGISMQNKAMGSRFRTPKAAAAKTKYSTTQSQMTNSTALMRPPFRLCTPGSGRFSAGVPSSGTGVRDATCSSVVSGVRLPAQSGLLKPGHSSIRPPIPLHSQRTSPKLKCQLPGLATRKPQRELPSTTKRENLSTARITSCQVASTAPSAHHDPNTSKAKPEQGTVSEQVEPAASEALGETLVSAAPTETNENNLSSCSGPVSSVNVAGEMLPSDPPRCRHLETCRCCYTKYHLLLKKNEELMNILGQVINTEAAVSQLPPTDDTRGLCEKGENLQS